MKKTTIYLMACLLAIFSIYSNAQTTVQIDLGNGENLTSGNWNNFVDYSQDAVLSNLIDATGVATGFNITVTDVFGGPNNAGLIATGSLDIPASGSQDSFYGTADSQESSSVEISGLNPAIAYSFTIFGSRDASDNRQTKYTINGASQASGMLNPSGNTSVVVEFADIYPQLDGKISIKVEAGPDNASTRGYYYLGVIKIDYIIPPVVIMSPVENAIWEVGKSATIEWETTASAVDIEYSSDNGLSWNSVATGISANTYSWTIPNDISDECIVKIFETGNTANTANSEGTFSIAVDDGKDYTIVILGSSTAAGTGASVYGNSWAGLYETYLQKKYIDFNVVNLANGGYVTAKILPTGTGTEDPAKNITAALTYNPDGIIINFPSNDAATGVTAPEQIANYNTVIAEAGSVPVWICAPQPRAFDMPQDLIQLELNESTFEDYGTFAIDFWEGFYDYEYSLKEGYRAEGSQIHMNDIGHNLLYNRVLAAKPDEYIFSGVETVIEVMSVELPEQLYVEMGASDAGLDAIIIPQNAANQGVSWVSSNTGVATINTDGDITAIAAGETNITVTTDEGGFTATCLVKVIAQGGAKLGEINIDLGRDVVLSVGNWNNLTDASTSGVVPDMLNMDGLNTGYSIAVTQGFSYSNTAGSQTIDASLGIPSNAGSDSFYGTGTGTSQLTISNLEPEYFHNFVIFASRAATDNREAEYTISGLTSETLYLDAANNSGNVVSVSGMKPAANGTITITVGAGPNNNSSNNYYYIGVIKMTVEATVVNVAGVTLNKNTSSLTVSNTDQLVASVFPSAAANKSVSWTSSNATVASVSTSGLVTANTIGTAIITVTTAEGDFTATCDVTVAENIVNVSGVNLNESSLNLETGVTSQLTETVTPSNANDKSVVWTSSDDLIATVSTSGLVTAVAAGTAVITVTTNDGSQTATCAVTVTDPAVDPPIIDAINDNEPGLRIYPNPVTNGTLNIEFATQSAISVELISIRGIVTRSQNVNANSIQISTQDLPKGLYFIKIQTAEKDIIKKCLIN